MMARVIDDSTWGWLTLWQEGRSDMIDDELLGRAEVIRNRAETQHRSIAAIVLAPLQFSGWNPHDPNRIKAAEVDDSDPAIARCRATWALAQGGTDVAHGALFYYDDTQPAPWWAPHYEEVAVIGTTHFLKPR